MLANYKFLFIHGYCKPLSQNGILKQLHTGKRGAVAVEVSRFSLKQKVPQINVLAWLFSMTLSSELQVGGRSSTYTGQAPLGPERHHMLSRSLPEGSSAAALSVQVSDLWPAQAGLCSCGSPAGLPARKQHRLWGSPLHRQRTPDLLLVIVLLEPTAVNENSIWSWKQQK